MTERADPTEVVDRLVSRMEKLWGPLPNPSPRDPVRMTEHNGYSNGQYRELKADVENLKGDFSDLKADMRAMSEGLNASINGLRDVLFERFDKFFDLQSKSRPDIYRTLGAATGVGAVMLVIIGGFGNLEKTILDTNIQFTNEKIATSNQVIKDDFKSTGESIKDVALAVADLRNVTIPRNELDYRLSDMKGDIKTLMDYKASVATLSGIEKRFDDRFRTNETDIERLKNDIVSRRENEQHWQEFTDRMNLISNRLTEVARATTGTSANEQIKQLQDAFQTFQNKVTVLAPSQK